MLAWLGLSSLAFVSDCQAADAGKSRQSRGARQAAKPRRDVQPASLMPTTVRNLRVTVSSEITRLVLDLDRTAHFVETLSKNPGRLTLEIPNARLAPDAKAKVATGEIPDLFTIQQGKPRSVTVSLPTASYRSYKLLTLSNPPRLVVDVVPQDQSPPPAADEPSTPAPPLDVPLQPVPPPNKSYKTIVLDPGHGGKDPGARGLRGTEEKDITLKVALKLKELLSKQPGVRVLMTRDKDVFVELEERANFANSSGADLFVSIHVNSHTQRSVKGIEIYHFGEAKDQRALEVAARENGTPLSTTGVGWEYLVADLLTTKKIEQSLEFAWTAKELMVAHLNGRYTMADHGVKTAPFYVLRFTTMPSILAEIAYISNPAEETLLRSRAFIAHVAESLFEGVQAFLSPARHTLR